MSGAPEAFTAGDANYPRFAWTLSAPIQAKGVPPCYCLSFHETLSSRMSHSRPWPVGYGVLLGNMHLLFAEVRISVTTIYGYEDVHGFSYPDNYLEIGSAMLSLIRCCQRTIQATTSADRDATR